MGSSGLKIGIVFVLFLAASFVDESLAISREQLRELGYNVERAERRYPRIRSISYEKAVQLLEHLEQDWKFSREFLVRYPDLLGHYLPELKGYWLGLTSEERSDILQLNYRERVEIVKIIRAEVFALPAHRREDAEKRLRDMGCEDWLDLVRHVRAVEN